VIVTALVMSTTVGLFFGIYPAVRASRLDPIVALRAE
jgi:putative ABC transport system permease protein